jgi:hypothetical protein
MSENIQTGFIFGGCCALIGCLTWFFNSRRNAFIKTFVPKEQLHEFDRSLPRDQSFAQGMRFIAMLQIGLGLLIALISLGAWLVSR